MKGTSLLAVVLCLAFATVNIQQADAQGWFSKLKDKAKSTIEDSAKQKEDEAAQKAKDAVLGKSSNSSSSSQTSSSSSQKSNPGTPAVKSYGQTIGAADNLIKKWPYDGVKGEPVGNIVLKGVKLGMPLPDAEAALDKAGYSRTTGSHYQRMYYELNGKRHELSAVEYYNLPQEQRGKILRAYVVELKLITPSPEIMKELPPYPTEEKSKETKLTADEQKRCQMYSSRNRMWSQGLSGAEIREIQDKCGKATGDTPGYSKEPQYVAGIWYGQKFLSGEKVNYEAFKAKARETFGEPTYAYNGTIQMAGDAYNRRGMMWYVDSALVSKSKIYTLLKKCSDDDRVMVFKDFIHPGHASNAFYPRAFQNSFDDMEEALRIAFAPTMAIGYERFAFAVDLEWPFLAAEKSYRRLWNEKKAQEAQPEADVKF